jgi:hypothetical protein
MAQEVVGFPSSRLDHISLGRASPRATHVGYVTRDQWLINMNNELADFFWPDNVLVQAAIKLGQNLLYWVVLLDETLLHVMHSVDFFTVDRIADDYAPVQHRQSCIQVQHIQSFQHIQWQCKLNRLTESFLYCINIFAKESSRSDWGSNLRPTATPPSTKYDWLSVTCEVGPENMRHNSMSCQ